MANERDAAGMAILEKAGTAISALEALGEASAQQIAEHAGEPVSSTYRLLASLNALGWVDQGSRRGVFRIGLRAVRVGGMLEDQMSVRDACRPALDDLRHEMNATSFLCYRRSDNAVCVERFAGRDVQSLAMRLGDSLPLHSGGAPLAILAFVPTSEREAILSRFAERRRNGERIPDEQLIRERVDRTLRRGYSVSDEDVTPGIAAVGAPIFNHRGELEGSISVSGIRSRILGDESQTAQRVKAAARDCSSELGYLEEVTFL